MRKIMERERTVISGLLALQLILWLGFVVHRSPRFPGSLAGGVLAISGGLLMILPPLIYSVAKRIAFFKGIITIRIRLSTLLIWHVYTSIIGSILAILHTGHRFESNLGIALTATMLLAVFSGFIGRHFFAYVDLELHEKQSLLNRLVSEFNHAAAEVSRQAESSFVFTESPGFLSRIINLGNIFRKNANPFSAHAAQLAQSIADVEYAIKTHELLKRRAKHWLWSHLATSLTFYLLLILHIWSAIYFGLRWLR